MTTSDAVHPLTLHRAMKAGWAGAALALAGAVGVPLVYPTVAAYVVAGLLVLLAVFLGLYLTVPHARLEGTVLDVRYVGRLHRVDLRSADRVQFQSAGAGAATLRVGFPDDSVALDLLALTDYMRSATPPHELLLLADALGDRPATAEVVPVLRKQAAHLQAGGGLDDSPLAAWASAWASGAGRAGAAGAVTDP